MTSLRKLFLNRDPKHNKQELCKQSRKMEHSWENKQHRQRLWIGGKPDALVGLKNQQEISVRWVCIGCLGSNHRETT